MRLGADRLAVVALLAFPAVACLRAPLGDPDLWWHLAAGEWIVRHRTVPWTDPFSFTAAGREWIAYSWLAEVLFHGLASELGFAALIVFRAVTAVVAVALVFAACRAAGARSIVAVAITGIAAAAMSGAWSERPYLLTVALLAFTSWLIRRSGASGHLPLSTSVVHLVWANVHVQFVTGLGLLATAAVAATIGRERSRSLWIATAAAAASTLVNPYGWHLHGHLTTIARQPASMPWIVEFQPPDPFSLHGAAAALLLAVTLVAVLRAGRWPSLFDVVTFAATLGLALAMARNVALFAVLAAPVAAGLVESAWPAQASALAPSRRRELGHALLAVGLVLWIVWSVPTAPGWREQIEPGTFPVGAADYVAARHPDARVLNDLDSGGFLIFRLAPQAKVSIDGRTQVYGEHLVAAHAAAYHGKDPGNRLLAEVNPDVVLWPRDGRFERRMREEPGWRVGFVDDISVVFEHSDSRPPGK